MKTHSKFLALVLSLALSLSLLPAAALADEAADTTPAETQSETANTEGTGSETPAAEPTKVADAAELTAAVAAGGSIQLTADIEVDATLNIVKDTTIDTNGSALTVKPASGDGFHIAAKLAPNFTLTDTSAAKSGSVLIDSAHNGIWLYGGSLTLDGIAVTIQNCEGYGIYNCNDSAAFTMTGGSLNIKDCATNSDEGGFHWDNGTVTFNSGDVNITGCGSGNFGAIYSGADLVFGNGTDTLTVNLENNPESTGVKNGIALVTGADMTVNSNATVNITIAGKCAKCRGFNIGTSDTNISVSGTLNISKADSCEATTVFGINDAASTKTNPRLTVNDGGLVNISGFSAPENVLPNVYVSMNGGSMDLGGAFTAAPTTSTLRLDADATLNETIEIDKSCAIDAQTYTLKNTPTTAYRSVNSGLFINGSDTDLTLTGTIVLDKGANGILFNSTVSDCKLDLENADLTISNAAGDAIYTYTTAQTFVMNGGKLTIKDCGTTNAWGGIDWDGGTMTFNSGDVSITGCGSTNFGAIYSAGDIVFGNGSDTLTVNLENNPESTGVKNALVLVGGKNLTINKNATVNITIAGTASECRGINIGTNASTFSVNGGTLNISKADSCTATTVHGVRGSACTPKMNVAADSIINISGCSEKSALTKMIVTITGGSMNLGEGVSDAATAGATSITNGEDAVTLQKQSANAYSIAIKKIAATTSAYPYTYTSHVNDGGVYAWIPVSCVNFYSDSSKTTLLGFCTAAGASTWKDAQAAAPDTTGLARFKSWVSETGTALTDDTAIDATKVLNVYATYSAAPSGGGGGSSSGGGTTITDPDVPHADTPSALNSTDHFAYVAGYEDGTVRPNANITRAEVATMFYRLLTNERRDTIYTAKSSFSDVAGTDWFNKAVSSMANGKYVTGYPDGSFGGNQSITRAEFVAIAARFMDAKTATLSFTDVPASYWAAGSISTAVAYGWIDGYTDGSFKPDQPITRAEAMKIINTMLARGVDAAGVTTGTKTWSDNADASAWYYYDVVEATNGHTYTGTRPSEKWTALGLSYSYDRTKYEAPDAK